MEELVDIVLPSPAPVTVPSSTARVGAPIGDRVDRVERAIDASRAETGPPRG